MEVTPSSFAFEGTQVPLEPETLLQPHQQRVVDRMRDGDRRLLLLHGLGTGKGLAALAAAESAGEPYAAITPAALRANFGGERRKFTDQTTPSDILSYTGVGSGAVPKVPYKTLILDECLPVGTLVDGKPIEEYRPGDFVWSANHTTGCLEQRQILRTAARLTNSICIVELVDGSRLVCTEEHPLYTQRGYIPAVLLTDRDFLIRLDGEERGNCADDRSDLCDLWGQVRNAPTSIVRTTETLLRGLLQGSMGKERSESQCSAQGEHPAAHARKQPHVLLGMSAASIGHAEGDEALSKDAWGQRARANSAGGGTGSRAELEDRLCGVIGASETRIPDALQVRCSESGTEDSGRGRWEVAQNAYEEGGRPEKGAGARLSRVASVTVYECGSGSEFESLCPGGIVYDLTVCGNHNFFAGGYLVHNSQRLRNPEAAQSKAVTRLADKADRLLLLSGSPIVNAPGDLAMPTNLLTGSSYTPKSFEDQFVAHQKISPGLWARLRGASPGEEAHLTHEGRLRRLLAGHVDYQPSKTPEGVHVSDKEIDTELSPEQSRFTRMLYGKLPWSLRYKLTNHYPLNRQELHNLQAFLVGPRQAGLSLLPFTNISPLEAFQQSSKLQEAGRNLSGTLQDPRTKALVFSNFPRAGLEPYAAHLNEQHIPNAIFHGGLSDTERKRIVDDYNRDKLRVLLLGPSAAEGISTKGTSLIQLLDPHFNEARSEQARGRGLRYDSHANLPEDLRNVKVERYLSHNPQQGWMARMFNRKQVPTSDEVLTDMAKRKQQLNDEFLQLLKSIGTQKEGRVIDDLKEAKRESDRKNYKGKHRLMRQVLSEHPGEFHIDSEQGHFVGIQHKSGFRMHLPRNVVPTDKLGIPPPARKTASPYVLPVAIGMLAPRSATPKKKKVVLPPPPAPDEPDTADILHDVTQTLRQRKAKQRQKLAEEWDVVPGSVVTRVKLGMLTEWPEGEFMDSPENLTASLVIGALAMPRLVKIANDLPPVPYDELELDLPDEPYQKRALLDYETHDLFMPTIPVDAFNNAVWTDVGPNPFGTRSTYGDGSQPIRTPPQVAAMVSGVVAGAGASRDSSHVSPWDVAMAAGAAAGKGWLGGLVLGKTVGALAGVSPEGQKKLQDLGLWGGLLTGAVRALGGHSE